MEDGQTCPECGSTRLEPGKLEGMTVRLDRSSTLKRVFAVGGVVACAACLDCGAISRLRALPEELEAQIAE